MVKLAKSYGLEVPIQDNYPIPIVANRAPTAGDTKFIPGQLWTRPTGEAYILASNVSGTANWAIIPPPAPATGTISTASDTANLDALIGIVTFTGKTTAAGATELLEINNDFITQGVGILATVSNTGGNLAFMTLEGIYTDVTDVMDLQIQNNGSAALNGDIIFTFSIIT